MLFAKAYHTNMITQGPQPVETVFGAYDVLDRRYVMLHIDRQA